MLIDALHHETVGHHDLANSIEAESDFQANTPTHGILLLKVEKDLSAHSVILIL